MTAVLDVAAQATPDVSAEKPASWGARAGAFVVDVLPGIAVVATMALLALAAPPWTWPRWVFTAVAVVAFLVMAVNRWLLPWSVGFSLGRALFGIRVMRRDGEPAGLWRLVARDFAHLLDTVPVLIGWLWPLWDRRRRTFADLLLRTEVLPADRPERNVRRDTAAMLLVVAVLCAAGAGLNYLAVYRQDRAVDAAREQIAAQGPRIVEQMLSYGVGTVNDDFARARDLVTDSYRPQLAAQQNAVQKAGPTSNEYWAVSSAVLSASKGQAAMLLAMQGQRGTDPKSLKFITATVRVDFEKSHDGRWRISNLTVLKQPQMNRAGQ